MSSCTHPITIRNPRTGHFIAVPCGHCLHCLQRRQNDWSIRLQLNDKYSSVPSWFVTLTYDDDHLTYASDDVPTLVKSDVQNFLKRLRKRLYGSAKGDLQYFICGEYGSPVRTARPHYHGVFFGLPDLGFIEINNIMEKCWKNGYCMTEEINPARCTYVAKYCVKDLSKSPDGVVPCFALMSKKIGYNFLSDNKSVSWYSDNDVFVIYNDEGTPYHIPRYLRDRMFTLEQVERHRSESEMVSWLKDEKSRSEKSLEWNLADDLASDSRSGFSARFDRDHWYDVYFEEYLFSKREYEKQLLKVY